jgi:hypothetical protein
MPPKIGPPLARTMETRAKNKSIHPGEIVKTSQRLTSAEVEEEREANVKAKASLVKAKKKKYCSYCRV